MTDTLKRLAGPTAPVQKSAGTSLYNPAGGVTAAVKSMLVHNTDPLMGAFLWLGVNDLTDMTKRLYSGLYIPAGDTLYVPLDIVLTSADTLYARQASVVDPASINFSTGVTPAQVGSASSVTSGAWTEVNGAAYVLCVMQRHASAVGTVTGFTDTHTGISWTLINTVVNSLNTVRTSLYRAISTGTTNTTTE